MTVNTTSQGDEDSNYDSNKSNESPIEGEVIPVDPVEDTLSVKSLTKGQLLAILAEYPDTARLELSFNASELESAVGFDCEVGPEGSGIKDKTFIFGLSGDQVYDDEADVVGLMLYSEPNPEV